MTAPLVYVVDASAAIPGFMNEPLSALSIRLFDCLANDPNATFHVPGLIYVECANAFWKHVQRGTIAPDKARKLMAILQSYRLTVSDVAGLASDALEVALTHGISGYDACYVVLSRRHNVPLITGDQKLVAKLTGAQPPVIWLGNWTPPAAPAASPTP